MGDNLKKTVFNAFKWSTLDRVAQQGVQFIIGIILARLLVPEDYGLIGMVMFFVQIAYVLVESGLGYALMRTPNITETHKCTVFYSNLIISLILYALFYFCAPSIAVFFNQPSITIIARITFLAIIFDALYIVPFNLLGRDLDYKSITKVNFGSTILSGLSGVIMALTGFGVWALVVQQTSYHGFRMILFHFYAKWKPQLLFSWQIIKGYASFSLHMLGTSMLTVLFNNVYTFLFGKLYPIKEVGFYTQGNKMSDTVNFTFISILGPTYSVFSKIHEQKERMVTILRSISQKVSIATIPISIFFIIVAEPLFYILFGTKWLDAVPFFQTICVANLFAPIYQVNIHAINALGLAKSTFRIELTKRILIVVSIVICLFAKSGMLTMLYFYVIACWLAFILTVYTIKKNLTIYYYHQLQDISRGILLSIVIGICCYCCTFIPVNVYALLCIECLATLAIYMLYITIFDKNIVAEVRSILKNKYE